MEPGLQPSFTFPSRNQTHNLAQGILNQAAATQTLLIKPKRATDIDLISSLESPLTVPKALDKDTIDPKPQLPVATPIYVQPGLAEGMTQLAQLTNADVEITKLLSANNALKRGNYRAAENILGRELSQEEIANRTITPLIRTSEGNPRSKAHLDEASKQIGAPFPGESLGTYEQRIKAFKHADEQLINTIAMHLNISPREVTELKSNMNFDGHSVLGFVKGDAYHRRQVLDLFAHHWNAWLGKTKEEKEELRNLQSNLEGENRPIHSGYKKAKSHAQLRRDFEEFSRMHPYGNLGRPSSEMETQTEETDEEKKYDEAAADQASNVAVPFDGNQVPMASPFEFTGAARSISDQLTVPDAPPYRPDPYVTPQGKQTVQVAVPMTLTLQNELKNKAQKRYEERRGNIDEEIATEKAKRSRDVTDFREELKRQRKLRHVEAPVDEEMRIAAQRKRHQESPFYTQLQEEVTKRRARAAEGERIPTITAPVDPDEFKEMHPVNNTTANAVAALEDADMKLQYKERHPTMEFRHEDLTIPEVNLVKTYALTENKEKDEYLSHVLNNVLGMAVSKARIQSLALKHERGELLDAQEVKEMKMVIRALGGSKSVAEGHDDEKESKRRRGETGGSLRPRRRLKKQKFTPYSRDTDDDRLSAIGENERWIPQTSSLDPRGGVVSGRLMRETGVNAIPISAQLQVSNTHQYTESPLLDWVKHPNSVDEIRPNIIPISQYVSKKTKPKKLGVEPAQRKVTFGGYVLDHHKLMHENTLSVMHPSGNKVKGMRNERISNGLRDAIHAVLTGDSINKRRLSPEDKLKLQTLLKKSKADVNLGGEVNVTPHKQLQLIMGEIEAGNDAPQLKTQLRKLLPILTSGGKISKEQADNIREHFL